MRRPAPEVADISRARRPRPRGDRRGRRHRNFIILAPTPPPAWGWRRHKIGPVASQSNRYRAARTIPFH